MTFSELGLRPEILRAVEEVGYTSPTPIQAQAIPVVLQGRDVLGIAQTGTGKTAGFTLPMIDILANGRAKARMPRSLILEPTRELAAQVAENFELYGKYEKLNYALLIGGERFDEQVRQLDRGVDVLIATPGRMLDLFERGKVLLADVKILVIDEADRMLDMGFIPDIERIVGLLPRIRQTLFFSATMPNEIKRLVDAFLINPKEIAVAPPSTAAERVNQTVTFVAASDKRKMLRRILGAEEVKSALIFCNRKRDVDIVYKSLTAHGFSAGQLHGDMAQPARTATLEQFKAGELPILVCSDVAARGIDISDLSHVVNFDVPVNPEDYIHRIGRTGRAGKSGRAITLATPDEAKALRAISTLLKMDIPVMEVEGFDAPADEDSASAEGRGRRRKAAQKQPARKTPKAEEAVVETATEEADAGSKSSAKPTPPARAAGNREDERGGRRRNGDRREKHERHVHDNGEREKYPGLGDHVPAFLLRPVPKQLSRATPSTSR